VEYLPVCTAGLGSHLTNKISRQHKAQDSEYANLVSARGASKLKDKLLIEAHCWCQRRLAHSIPPSMLGELDELDEQLAGLATIKLIE
jgi:hypothetical protein